jgi:hypothetical protein
MDGLMNFCAEHGEQCDQNNVTVLEQRPKCSINHLIFSPHLKFLAFAQINYFLIY